MGDDPGGSRELVRAVQVSPSWDTSTALAYVLEALDGLDRRFAAILAERDRRHEETTEQADRRYQERFEASRVALDAAFLAQKESTAAMVAAHKQQFDVVRAADREAVAKAESSMNERLKGMNELRGALSDLQSNLVTRNEFKAEMSAVRLESEAKFNALNERTTEQAARLDRAEGRTGGYSAVWGGALGIIGLIIAALALLYRVTQ